jgi:Flp pilus assembly protein TadG
LIFKGLVPARISSAKFAAVRRFACDNKADVAMIFGLLLPAMILATGIAVDYTAAARKKVVLDAAADAAALSGVTPAMLKQSDAAAVTTATNMFNGQAAGISGLEYNPKTLAVSSSTDAGTGLRTVTVTYNASSENTFFNILPGKTRTWAIGGSATATARPAPNIDFYLLLDNSPSMAIAATTAGINTMVSKTSAQGGCAFACHETNPAADNLGNPGGIDNYQLAKNLGVVTRIDNLRSATGSLMDLAVQTENNNNATYRMGIYTFNYNGATQISALTTPTGAKPLTANIDVMVMYKNNWRNSSTNDNDAETNFELAMSQINNKMPAPGTGYTGSTPQEVLLLVSDGLSDRVNTGNPGLAKTPVGTYSGSRFMGLFDTSWCDTVKSRGIRIAVLYTEYLPLPTNAWYNTYVSPNQSKIAANMQSCASSGLYSQITTDGDISQAINTLFAQAVQTATLLK